MATATDRTPTILPCCIDVPGVFQEKAWYGLRMLLLPLGIDPRPASRDELGERGLYYGSDPDSLPEGVVVIRHAQAAGYFASQQAFDGGDARWVEWEGEAWPVLFDEGPELTALDLIASAFFWLSGWQERVVRTRDPHGRFPVRASLQQHLGIVTRPAVDAYREILAKRLEAAGLQIRRRAWGDASWAFCPTHDIDYLKKWRKGLIYREVVQHLLLNRRQVSPAQRLRRLDGFLRQWSRPGDVYRSAFDRILFETRQRDGTATFFFKAGAHGSYDVPYALDSEYLKERLAALVDGGFEVGLHPSYFAHTHPFYLSEERDRLAARVEVPIVSVRQHYLRYDPLQTPRLHADLGFRIESSLGFAECEGFRHATCLPFQLYDCEADEPLPVWEMPLCLMESALFNRQGYTLEEARQATNDLMATCRRFGGAAVMLWHNILWDELDHPGWGAHFEAALDRARAEGARIASLHQALASWLGRDLEVHHPEGTDVGARQ